MEKTLTHPLCIDLDGTLIHTDALVESAVRSFFTAPLASLAGIASLRHGRAAFKQRMLRHGNIDVSLLPYNEPLIARLKSEKEAGRTLVLVTAADQHIAHAVQAHLDLFDEVHASDGQRNLKGHNKGAFLAERYGEHGFVYAGDALADRAVWSHAAAAWTVGATGLAAARQTGVNVDAQFDRPTASASDWLRALRADQWFWNLLVFLPLVLALGERSWSAALLAAFGLFCLVDSGANLITALASVEKLRAQPHLRMQPVSSGRISLVQAGVAGGALMVAGTLFALGVTPWLSLVLLVFAVSRTLLDLLPNRWRVAGWLLGAWLAASRVWAGQIVTPFELSWPTWVVIVAALLAVQPLLKGRIP